MKIQSFRRYTQDDYRGSPDWFKRFLDVANLMVDTLNALLQGNIDLTNNMLSERQTVALTHNVPQQIKLQSLKVQPYLVRAGYAAGNIVTACSITAYNTDGTLQVTALFNGAPTGAIQTTLVFEP